jgi:hypothetical protein
MHLLTKDTLCLCFSFLKTIDSKEVVENITKRPYTLLTHDPLMGISNIPIPSSDAEISSRN